LEGTKSRFGAPVRDVSSATKRGEPGVSGKNGIPNDGKAGITQALLIGFGDTLEKCEKG